MKPTYLYDLDDHPPLQLALVYGLQWACIMFPALIIVATLGVESLGPGGPGKIRFFQLTLLISGLFTFIQTLWGHRYPVLEGPAAALVLTFILLAPRGLPALQGGMIIGGGLLIAAVLSGQIERLIKLFTPNVVGVILILIALGLLRPLIGFMVGGSQAYPHGEGKIFLITLFLVLFMATLSHWLKGLWRTISILIGLVAGSLVFLVLGRLSWQDLGQASWVSISTPWLESMPRLYWPSVVAFAGAYLAVMVNTLGSLQGVAAITDEQRLPGATKRGILVNGMGGITCGFLGIVGTVSYSMSPGVILVNRVATRYAVTYCGIIIGLAAFFPKLAALLSLIPKPVIGAALCVAMGGQIGVGIATVASRELTSRDYFVAGLPILIGTMVGFLPEGLFRSLPAFAQVFVGNGLVAGIFLVLLLEHLLLRKEDP